MRLGQVRHVGQEEVLAAHGGVGMARFLNTCTHNRYPPRFDGAPIAVEKAGDPTNLLWENLQVWSTCGLQCPLSSLETDGIVLLHNPQPQQSPWRRRVTREVMTTMFVVALVAASAVLTAVLKSPDAVTPGHHHPNIFAKLGLPSVLATLPLSICTVAINLIIKCASPPSLQFAPPHTMTTPPPNITGGFTSGWPSGSNTITSAGKKSGCS